MDTMINMKKIAMTIGERHRRAIGCGSSKWSLGERNEPLEDDAFSAPTALLPAAGMSTVGISSIRFCRCKTILSSAVRSDPLRWRFGPHTCRAILWNNRSHSANSRVLPSTCKCWRRHDIHVSGRTQQANPRERTSQGSN
jgi:hypothetical protein